MKPYQVIETLHLDGFTNDIQIYQDLTLAHEGVPCQLGNHTLTYEPEKGFVLDGKEG